MIYFTGDCHGDWTRFSKRNFPEQETMTREDYVFVLGDFGIWQDYKGENEWLDWLEERPFTILFCDGNHENFPRLYSFEEVDYHGGRAHKIRENVYHLMRGYVFDFDGKSIFVFGGARSHDIRDGILYPEEYSKEEFMEVLRSMRKESRQFRVNGVSWWKEEMPSPEEMELGRKNLASHGNEIDYIISHCAPKRIEDAFLYTEGDPLTEYFNEIMETAKFRIWWFGHYHDNKKIFGKFVMLYDQIVECPSGEQEENAQRQYLLMKEMLQKPEEK